MNIKNDKANFYPPPEQRRTRQSDQHLRDQRDIEAANQNTTEAYTVRFNEKARGAQSRNDNSANDRIRSDYAEDEEFGWSAAAVGTSSRNANNAFLRYQARQYDEEFDISQETTVGDVSLPEPQTIPSPDTIPSVPSVMATRDSKERIQHDQDNLE